MEESAPPDPHAGLRQELELLAKESQVYMTVPLAFLTALNGNKLMSN